MEFGTILAFDHVLNLSTPAPRKRLLATLPPQKLSFVLRQEKAFFHEDSGFF
jgi:hypothetical protein